KLLREDSKYLYFKADTPGFTHFAITGNTIEKPTADTKPAAETSEPEEKNTTVNETKKEQNSQQGTGKDKVTSIPGFEGLCVVACLITLFLHKKK
ncbi:PGF-pre-PGF domain-containing protein, partial [Methanosarcina thermophila]